MTTEKRLGIWMDHANAYLTDYSAGTMETTTIASTFTHEDKTISIGKGENLMHNKEQHRQAEYYKKIGEVIKKYEEVILFGPTNAKVELFNMVNTDHLFANINIKIKQTDKMSESQQHTFIRDYFTAKVNDMK